MKKLAIATFLFLALGAAQAQMYGELGYATVNTRTTFEGETFKSSPNALRGIFGYEINPHFSVELMLGLNLGSSKLNRDGQAQENTKLKLDRMTGIYLKPKIELAPGLEAFGRVGFMDAKATSTLSSSVSSRAQSGVSYGAGLSYVLTKTVSVNLDYMHYGKKDDATVKGFTAGVGFKF